MDREWHRFTHRESSAEHLRTAEAFANDLIPELELEEGKAATR